MVIHVPSLVHKSAMVTLGFLVLDTVTSYICAARKQGSSHWKTNYESKYSSLEAKD